MTLRRAQLAWSLLLGFTGLPLFAQDPARADPQHFKVEYEDDRVRVLRFRLAPGEKSPLHEHSERVTVFLSGGLLQITNEAGQLETLNLAAGSVQRQPATRHSVENTGTQIYEELTTEFKDAESQLPAIAASRPKPESPTTTSPSPKLPSPSTPAETSKPLAPIAKESYERPSRRGPASINPFNTVNLHGTQLAFIEQGRGTPVVFVHGALGDYRTWAAQMAALSPRYHTISYSRRYHFPNLSTGKEHDYTYEQNAKDLAEFISGLQLGPVHLVGQGYGAAISAIVASQHPELVRSVVIAEPGFESLLDSTVAYRSRWARDEIYGIIRKPLSRDNPEKGVQVYHDWIAETEPWTRLSAEEQFQRKQNANALRAQTNYPMPPAFTCEDAKKIKAPVLLVSGQNRTPNSAEITGVLSACIAGSERVTIPNTGAAAYLDNPQGYNKAVAEFLNKH